MALEFANLVAAIASANSNGTALFAYGCSLAQGTAGTGTYAVTLEQACNANQCICLSNPRISAPASGDRTPSWVHATDSLKVLTYTNGGTATNTACDILVLKTPLS